MRMKTKKHTQNKNCKHKNTEHELYSVCVLISFEFFDRRAIFWPTGEVCWGRWSLMKAVKFDGNGEVCNRWSPLKPVKFLQTGEVPSEPVKFLQNRWSFFKPPVKLNTKNDDVLEGNMFEYHQKSREIKNKIFWYDQKCDVFTGNESLSRYKNAKVVRKFIEISPNQPSNWIQSTSRQMIPPYTWQSTQPRMILLYWWLV